MPVNAVRFKPNVPHVLTLESAEGELDDFNQVHYQLADGRRLTVSHETAVKINLLEIAPGQTFGICKDWTGERKDPVHFRVWLTPQTEQEKAAAEQPSEIEQQLGASIDMAQGQGPRAVPRKLPQTAFEFDHARGTGTYGPAPKPAVAAKASSKPPSGVPYAEALRHITRTVVAILNEQHEQWNDAAKQDLVSTALIAACKAGRVLFDFTEPAK